MKGSAGCELQDISAPSQLGRKRFSHPKSSAYKEETKTIFFHSKRKSTGCSTKLQIYFETANISISTMMPVGNYVCLSKTFLKNPVHITIFFKMLFYILRQFSCFNMAQ